MMNNCKINILATSISKKVPFLKSLRKASEQIGNVGKIFGADSNATCIGQYFVDVYWNMPRLSELSIDGFIDYCKKQRISCIIPTRDEELLFFSEYKAALLNTNIKIMLSDYEAVETCLDKLLFFENVNSKGFPSIKTSLTIEALDCDKYCVKERYGAGATKIGLDLSKDQAVAFANTLNKPVFQPFIQGEELSIDLYLCAKERSKGVVIRTRDLVVDGESQVTTTLKNRKLENLCSALAESLKLYGHVMFQCLRDEQENFHIIECNCRFGGASSLSIEVGLDSFYWFLLEVLGEDIEEYPFSRSEIEKKQIRYSSDLLMPL